MIPRRRDDTVTAAVARATGHTLIHVPAAINAPATAGRRATYTSAAIASGAENASRRSIDTGASRIWISSQYQAAG